MCREECPMNTVQVALYARVSSDQQSEAKTIESQVADLQTRIAATGATLSAELEFIDNGYSGATLIRPALERLRDVAAAGGIDQLYVHCPDRLARNYAHQVLLLEEFIRSGVEVIFFNREVGQTPEDQLLLQVQGMIAEYERAKILERSRRGKRHAAQVGRVSVLSCAPYGYRYISPWDAAGEARFDIVPEEARVVRQIFEWVGQDRCSIGEVVRRLNAAHEQPRTGKTVWDRATVWGILKNPAYKGEAAFGKTAVEPLRPRLRAQRSRSLQPKKAYSVHDVPPDQWLSIPVLAIVDAALFDTVQEHPERLEQEYRRRLVQEEKTPDELSSLQARMGRLRQGIARLIDSYAEGLIDKEEFEPRMTRMRERLKQIQEQAQQIMDEASLERELTLILGRLDEFAGRIKQGLHQADWLTRREIIRALVKRVEIDQEQVRVVFRVNPPPPSTPQASSEKASQSLQHCGRRAHAALRCPAQRLMPAPFL